MIGGFVAAAAAAMTILAGSYSAPMHASEVARDMILMYEDFSPEAVEEKPGFYTIGFGMEVNQYSDGYQRFVENHEKVTREEAALVFEDKLAIFEKEVYNFAKEHSLCLSQNQFDALIDYSYNRGCYKLKNDYNNEKKDGLGWTLAMRLSKAEIKEIWLHDGITWKGNFHQGLYNRRVAEYDLYNKN